MANEPNEIPRRIRVDLFTPAELAIWHAQQAVEMAGGSPLLTEASNLLSAARAKVADHVDGRSQREAEQQRREAADRIEGLERALTGLVEAVTAEVNEKGGGGYILARLSDARAALGKTAFTITEAGRAALAGGRE